MLTVICKQSEWRSVSPIHPIVGRSYPILILLRRLYELLTLVYIFGRIFHCSDLLATIFVHVSATAVFRGFSK